LEAKPCLFSEKEKKENGEKKEKKKKLKEKETKKVIPDPKRLSQLKFGFLTPCYQNRATVYWLWGI